ncbi:hypothetical protein GCM10022630_34050 [Thermobifida alba]
MAPVSAPSRVRPASTAKKSQNSQAKNRTVPSGMLTNKESSRRARARWPHEAGRYGPAPGGGTGAGNVPPGWGGGTGHCPGPRVTVVRGSHGGGWVMGEASGVGADTAQRPGARAGALRGIPLCIRPLPILRRGCRRGQPPSAPSRRCGPQWPRPAAPVGREPS